MTYRDLIIRKMKEDRDPEMVQAADKIAVRGFVSKIIGDNYLVPLISCGYGKMPDMEINDAFVAKPNNASGRHVFNDKENLSATINSWIDEPYKDDQWVYTAIKPGYIIERKMHLNGNEPHLFRVFVFHGKAALVWRDVYGKHGNRTLSKDRRIDFWLPDGTPVPVSFGKNRTGRMHKAPLILKEVIYLAEKTGASFDHVRVDFMLTDSGLKFSEFTFYPVGGSVDVKPKKYDQMLVKAWGKK